MDDLQITEDDTREEIEECLRFLAHTASRLPRHYVDKKAALHAKIDVLLFEWELRA